MQLAMRWMCSLIRPPQRTYFDFLPDTLGGVRQFLCGAFGAYLDNTKRVQCNLGILKPKEMHKLHFVQKTDNSI